MTFRRSPKSGRAVAQVRPAEVASHTSGWRRRSAMLRGRATFAASSGAARAPAVDAGALLLSARGPAQLPGPVLTAPFAIHRFAGMRMRNATFDGVHVVGIGGTAP